MKQFFKTSLYVAIFAISGVLFQISCSNSDKANSSSSNLQTGKLVYLKFTPANAIQIWTCDYDGQNKVQVVPVLPADVSLTPNNSALQTTVKIAADGTKIFFVGFTRTAAGVGSQAVFSCDLDGQNVQEILSEPDITYYYLQSIN